MHCTDAAYCYRCLCVRLLVATMSCAKTAEPIENWTELSEVLRPTRHKIGNSEPIDMPFEMWTQVGKKNHVLSGARIPQGNEQFRRGILRSTVKYKKYLAWAKVNQ